MTSHKYKTEEGVAMVKGLVMFYVNNFTGVIMKTVFKGECKENTKYFCQPINALKEQARLQLNN